MASNYYELLQLLPNLPARLDEAVERFEREVVPIRTESPHKDEGLKLLADLRAGLRLETIGDEIRQWFDKAPRPAMPPPRPTAGAPLPPPPPR